MEPPIPLKSVVLFIACGTMLFVIVFIFAKRQITRFTLKSSRAPHATIGADAPKALRTEIERRLRHVANIRHEPQLMSHHIEDTVRTTFNGEPCHFIYRMKAVDALAELDKAFKDYSVNIQRIKSGSSLRPFLLEQRQSGPLVGIKLDIIEKFCSAYDHARHDPAEFSQHHYEEFKGFLHQLTLYIYNRKNLTSGPRLTTGLDKPQRSSPEGPSMPSILEQQAIKQDQLLQKLQPSPANQHSGVSNPTNQGSSSSSESPANQGQDGNPEVTNQSHTEEEVTYRPRKRKDARVQRPVSLEQAQGRESEGSSSYGSSEEHALIHTERGSKKVGLKGQSVGESVV